MKKKDIKTGAILEIPLEKDYGYGYVKLIFSGDIQPDIINLPIIRIYNLFKNTIANKDEINIEYFENNKLVMYPLLLIGYPIFRGKKKWELKGYTTLNEEEKLIPDYLKIPMGEKFYASTIKEKTKSEFGCLLIRNFQMIPIQVKKYELIKHIGQWAHYSPKDIRKLLTMYWIHKNGDNIKKYYTNEEFNTNMMNKLIYDTIIFNNNDEFVSNQEKGRLKAKIKD